MVTKNSNNLSEIQAQWVTVRSKIRQKIGDAQFASWIKLLTLEDYSDQKVTLSVPSSFIRTRIIEQYLDIIKSYWYVQNLKINDIKIVVTKKDEISSTSLQKKELKEVIRDIKKYFKYYGFYCTVVPSYIGGFMALVWASNNFDLLKKRNFLINKNIKTEYFNKEILNASFSVPNFLKK